MGRWRKHLSVGRVLAIATIAIFVVIAIIGPVILGDEATRPNTGALSEGSSAAHPLGTDELGRDMLARTLVATRLSLVLAVVTALLAFAVGVLVGMLPVVLGRRTQRFMSASVNLTIAFPAVLLVLLVTTVVGVGTKGAVIGLAIAGLPTIARMTQTLASGVAGSDYMAAARGLGLPWHRQLIRHVLPNIAPPLAVQFTMGIGAALLSFSALSFLGIGVRPPNYDWGSLLDTGLDRLYVTPIAPLGPAAAIVLVSLSLSVLGDALADALAVAGPQRRSGPARTASPAGAPVGIAAVGTGIVRVEDLTVSFDTPEGDVTPVRHVSFAVEPGERLGIVGESGSGKSLTALATAQLVDTPGTARARVLEIDGADLARMAPPERDRHLATSLALVFQDPLSALNPVLRVGRQVTEGAIRHLGIARLEASRRAAEHFRELSIAGGARALRQYPHELSGGMRQRAIIAMGLMTEPRILIADEPTTALDVTIQRQVLRTLREVNVEHGTAIVLISHDILVIEAFCERVLVMYAGHIVEEIAAERLREHAAHPYTRALLAAVPRMDTDRGQPLTVIPGRPPAARDIPAGCPFAPRCQFASARCHSEQPALARIDEGHLLSCWHPQVEAMAEERA